MYPFGLLVGHDRWWVFAFSVVVLPMLVLNILDIFVRGMHNRPPGYFAFWMIPVFDILFFPLFFVASMGVYQSFSLTRVESAVSFLLSIVASVLVTIVFWRGENTAVSASPPSYNWTVDKTGHNVYAVVHALIMFAVVQYTVAFLIRYGIHAVRIGEAGVWYGFGWYLFIFCGVTYVAAVLLLKAPSPNDVLSNIFNRPINF